MCTVAISYLRTILFVVLSLCIFQPHLLKSQSLLESDIIGLYARSKTPLEILFKSKEYTTLAEKLSRTNELEEITVPFKEAKRPGLQKTLYFELVKDFNPQVIKDVLEETALFDLIEYEYRAIVSSVSGFNPNKQNDDLTTECANPSSYNDPGSLSTSHLEAMELPCAWTITHGSPGIIVGVVDAGFFLDHPDLSGKVVNSPYINPITNEADLRHGTAVAGGVAARVNNNLCVAGAGYDTRVTLYQARRSYINKIFEAYQDGNPIITASLVTGSPNYNQTYHDVMTEVTNGGSLVTQAVLGGGTISFQGISGCILVGQADVNGNYVPYGPGVSSVGNHPDVGIEMLVPIINSARLQNPNDPTNVCGIGSANSSMAAPHVAGTAALMLSVNSCLTPSQIEQILTTNTNIVPNYSSHASTLNGAGNLNAYQAVLEAQRGSIDGAEVSGPIYVAPNTDYNYSIPFYSGVSYNWSVSGAATLVWGQGSQSVYVRTASSASSFQVQCTITKGSCSVTKSKVSFNDGGGRDNFQVTAYPNPTSNGLNITINTETKDTLLETSNDNREITSEEFLEYQFMLYDPFGRQVRSVTGGEKVSMDTKDLKKGFYTLRVTHEAETVTQRIEIRK